MKAIEATTNHDVKAMEYWLEQRLGHNPEVTRVTEFIHFGCTSGGHQQRLPRADARDGREAMLLPALDKIIARLVRAGPPARQTCRCSPAPTASPPARPPWAGDGQRGCIACATLRKAIAAVELTAKFNGAVGNY